MTEGHHMQSACVSVSIEPGHLSPLVSLHDTYITPRSPAAHTNHWKHLRSYSYAEGMRRVSMATLELQARVVGEYVQ
ncbi:hypothetical protein MHYP_G00332900 [Metynnis hypsauchen]